MKDPRSRLPRRAHFHARPAVPAQVNNAALLLEREIRRAVEPLLPFTHASDQVLRAHPAWAPFCTLADRRGAGRQAVIDRKLYPARRCRRARA